MEKYDMAEVHCYTSISFSYLGRARVLAETVRRLHPEWVIWLCLSDRAPAGFEFDLENEPFDHIIWTHNLPIDRVESWIFKHNVIELCTAVKGFALKHILDFGADKVIYIDPDIALFNTLHPVVEALDTVSIVLTPHLVEPETTLAAIDDNERSALMHGVYNLGFIAVRNSAEGHRFASWWAERLAQLCYEEAARGIYTDQRWCDLVPAFFDEVHILRDPGYNVASWNLSKRHIQFNSRGLLEVNGNPLRFYHFTKIDKVGEAMIERYAGSSTAVFELVKWYRDKLSFHKPKHLPDGHWHYAHFSDGTPIRYAERVLYRRRQDLIDAFPDPYASDSFLAWLKSPDGISALHELAPV